MFLFIIGLGFFLLIVLGWGLFNMASSPTKNNRSLKSNRLMRLRIIVQLLIVVVVMVVAAFFV